jgi:hypothetical protein
VIARLGASPVDHRLGGLDGDRGLIFLDVDNRTDEVHTDVTARSSAKNVIPQLLAFLLRPGIGALVDGDDELRDVLRISRSLASVAFMDSLLGPDQIRSQG